VRSSCSNPDTLITCQECGRDIVRISPPLPCTVGTNQYMAAGKVKRCERCCGPGQVPDLIVLGTDIDLDKTRL